jgi:hypothetical protein
MTKIKHMTLKQMEKIIANDFGSTNKKLSSNDKYVNYKDEILEHYYDLTERKNDKDFKKYLEEANLFLEGC